MLLQVLSALLIVTFVQHVENRKHFAVNNLEIVVFNILCQITVVGFRILLIVGDDNNQRFHCTGNCNIEHIRIIDELTNDVIH